MYLKNQGLKKRLIFLFPIFILIISYYLFKFFPKVYFDFLWGHESSYPNAIGEWIQFAFFIFAFFVTLYNIYFLRKRLKKSKNFGLITFSSFSFFVAMEEISWGQNIFGFINTPDFIAKINFQNQITLHNLNPIQAEFLLFNLPFSILHLFFVILGLILGLCFPIRYKLFDHILRPFIPTWYLSIYFFIPAIFYLSVSFGLIEWWHQELFETILALGFALLSFINLQEFKVK